MKTTNQSFFGKFVSGKIVAGLLAASLIIAGSAFAAQNAASQKVNAQAAKASVQNTADNDCGEGVMKPGKRHNGPIEMLGRFQFENIAAKTISELTSQPVETVAAKLKENRLPKVLKEYNITKDAFHTAMKPKFIALVHKRVEDGSITAAQETLVLEALEKQGNRHAIMEKLVKNGVTAGIITQEEADKMLSHGGDMPPAE